MRRGLALAVALLLLLHAVLGAIDLTNYVLTFEQDFTTMTFLNVSNYGTPSSVWMAHTPTYKDWCNFINPSGNYKPFSLDGNVLTIRSQEVNATTGAITAGMLSSMSQQTINGVNTAVGFAQKYGYFEMSAKLPPGAGTWPAFWMLDSVSLVNSSVVPLEIDVIEQYGKWQGMYHTTIHYWDSPSWANGTTTPNVCTQLVDAYHTYGVDIQPDFLTFYFDRVAYWQVANTVPGGPTPAFDRPFYVMVNLAYGGADGQNPPPSGFLQDMLVQYVRVWQGSGGSANGFATDILSTVTYPGFQLRSTQPAIVIDGVSLRVSSNGSLQLHDSAGNLIWQVGSAATCSPSCYIIAQGDGNVVLYNSQGPYWATSTNSANEAILSNQPPYFEFISGNCKQVWSTNVTVPSCNGIIGTAASVCSGHGNCTGPEVCSCVSPWSGPYCAAPPTTAPTATLPASSTTGASTPATTSSATSGSPATTLPPNSSSATPVPNLTVCYVNVTTNGCRDASSVITAFASAMSVSTLGFTEVSYIGCPGDAILPVLVLLANCTVADKALSSATAANATVRFPFDPQLAPLTFGQIGGTVQTVLVGPADLGTNSPKKKSSFPRWAIGVIVGVIVLIAVVIVVVVMVLKRKSWCSGSGTFRHNRESWVQT